ncbi:hypothetical protein F5876DRAFT_68003 [Lentinula aff. lateritia]|uniref:Uncharacterized protein n=1 Tax=Lentinula aff. lateritia TaxID=2804960 RepID=A0ACC1TS73_9AGAR|nr:hypothetical protein F5876DRAFT_68003 [Lentinula aff. lateritia]
MSSFLPACTPSSGVDCVFQQQFWKVYDTAIATIRRNGFSSPAPVDWAAGLQNNFTKEFLDEIYSIALTGIYSECTTSQAPPAQSIYSHSISEDPASNTHYQVLGRQPLPQCSFAPSYEDFFASLSSSSYNRPGLLAKRNSANMCEIEYSTAALNQKALHTPMKAHVCPQPSPEITPTPTRQQPSLEITPTPKAPKPTRAELRAAYHLMGFSKKSLDFMNDHAQDMPISNDSDSELSSATRGFEPTQVQLGRRKYLLDTAGIEDEDSETGEEEIEEQESDDNELLSGRTMITALLLKIRISKKDKTEVVEKQNSIAFIFLVPVDDANEEFHLTMPISWADFEYAVANTLGIAPRQNKAQLQELIKDAQKAYAKSRVKTKKKFVVVLKCTDEQLEKPGKDKDGKGKVKTSKKHKHSDGSEEEDEEEGMKTKVLSQVQWIAKISKDNHCPDYNCICLKSITSHPQLRSADIAT